MLYQTDIYTAKTDTDKLYSDLSVKIHGFIMSRIDTTLAAELHSGKVNPLGLYTTDAGDYYITRVSVLNDSAKQIIDVLQDVKTIRVFGTENNLIVLHTENAPVVDIGQLPGLLRCNKYDLGIITPAMFRREGVWQCPPEIPSYFLSVAAKLEHLENIRISKQDVINEFQKVKFNSYDLHTEKFMSGSKRYTGIKGRLSVTLPQKKGDNDILRLLLAYATYTGVGGMTPQGMGGFVIERT